MARSKKDAKILNIKLDTAVHTQLEQYCEETGQTKTVAVERILGKYFTSYFSESVEKRTLGFNFSE